MSRPPTTDRSPGRGGRTVSVRLSAAEYYLIAAMARAAGVSVPEYVRALALAAALR